MGETSAWPIISKKTLKSRSNKNKKSYLCLLFMPPILCKGIISVRCLRASRIFFYCYTTTKFWLFIHLKAYQKPHLVSVSCLVLAKVMSFKVRAWSHKRCPLNWFFLAMLCTLHSKRNMNASGKRCLSVVADINSSRKVFNISVWNLDVLQLLYLNQNSISQSTLHENRCVGWTDPKGTCLSNLMQMFWISREH